MYYKRIYISLLLAVIFPFFSQFSNLKADDSISSYNPVHSHYMSKKTAAAVAADERCRWNMGVNDGNMGGLATYPARHSSTTGWSFLPYKDGHNESIWAIPKGGYHFEHWEDGGTDNPRKYVFNVDEITDKAHFAPGVVKHTVTIQSENTTMGTVSGDPSGEYTQGTEITIKAEANTGYHFMRWKEDGNKKDERTILILQDTTLTAMFGSDDDKYYLYLGWTKIGKDGIIEDSRVSPLRVLCGVNYPATPDLPVDDGYHFVKWTLGDTDYDIAPEIRLTDNDTIWAIWEINKYVVVTQSSNTLYGEASDTTEYYYNDNVTLQIDTVYEHCHFVHWQDTLHSTEPEVSTYSFIMDKMQNHNDSVLFVAVFAPDSVLITVQPSCDTCGQVKLEYTKESVPYITPDWANIDSAKFQWDDHIEGRCDKITLYARAEDCFKFAGWTANGTTITTSETDSIITLDLPDDSVAYVALFEPIEYNFTVEHKIMRDGVELPVIPAAATPSADSVYLFSKPSDGWQQYTSPIKVRCYDSVAAMISVDTVHYKFLRWKVSGNTNLYDTVEVVGDTSLVAVYEPKKFQLALYSEDTAEKGTVEGLTNASAWAWNADTTYSDFYYYYDTIEVRATSKPNSCYRFKQWVNAENDIVLSTDSQFLFTPLTGDMALRAEFEYKKDTITIHSNPRGTFDRVTYDDIVCLPEAEGRILSSNSNELVLELNCGYDVSFSVKSSCGYYFTAWDTNNDNNPDLLTDGVTAYTTQLDSVTIAYYSITDLKDNVEFNLLAEKKKFHVQIIFDPEQGTPWWAPGRPGETNDEWIYADCIQLFASPKSCYEFDHWQYGNNPSNTGTEWNGICICSDTVFYAFYKQKKWNITFGPNNADWGKVDAEYLGTPTTSPLPTMYCDSTFTLTPVAFDGYRFIRWSDGSTDSVRNIVVDNNTPHNFTAIFAPPIALTLEARTTDGALGGGEFVDVTATGGTLEEVTTGNPWVWYTTTSGTQVTFSPKPIECYKFMGWEDGVTDSVRSVVLTDTVTYTALFEEVKYMVTVILIDDDTNLEISRQTEHVRCSDPNMIWNFNGGECYEFVKWADGGYPELREIMGVNSDTTFIVYYNRFQSTTTVQSAGHGTAYIQETSTTSVTDYCGETYTLIANAQGTCYEFKQWNDGNTDSIRTINLGKEDKTYIATFGLKEFLLKASVSPAEAGTISGVRAGGIYSCGDVVMNLTATPASECYTFLNWSDGETSLTHSPITMSCDVELTANFKKESYTVKVILSEVGAANVSVNGISGLTYSLECTEHTAQVDAQINYGYCFIGWDFNNDGNVDTGYEIDSLTQSISHILTDIYADTTITIKCRKRKFFVQVNSVGDCTVKILQTGKSSGWFDYGTFLQIDHQVDQCHEVSRITAGAGEQQVWSRSGGWTYGFNLTRDTLFTGYCAPIDVYITFGPNDERYGRVEGLYNGVTYNSAFPAMGCDSVFTLTPVAADNYNFIGWTDGNTDSVRTIMVTPSIARTYTALFAPEKERLTLNAVAVKNGVETGQGGGLFILDPLPYAETNPVSSGTYVYSYPDTISVAPVPQAGYKFIGWRDTNDSLRSVVMAADISLTALFEKTAYVVTVVTDPEGAATVVTDKADYTDGETVNLTLSVDPCYEFAQWEDGTTNVGKSFVIHNDTTLRAQFLTKQYSLTLDVDDPTHGTVNGGGSFDCGSTVTATATPATNYRFVRWIEVDSRQNPYSFELNSNVTLTAEFELDLYTLYVEVSPDGSATTVGQGTYLNGTDVEVKVTSVDCKELVSWSDTDSKASTRVVHLTSDSIITAYMDWHYYNVTTILRPTDAGQPIVKSVQCGESDVVYPPSVYGWTFLRWNDGTTGAQEVNNVRTDITFTAYMERNQYKVDVDCDATQGVVSGGGLYYYEDIVLIEAVPTDGYEFVAWSNGELNPYYSLTVESDTALTAFFRPIPYTIYVIYDDTVCTGEDYVLPSGRVIPYNSAVGMYVDTTDFEYETGMWCKRIFTVTLHSAAQTPQPVITTLPSARAGEPLHNLEDISAEILSIVTEIASALSPAITDYYWEILDVTTATYYRYMGTSLAATDSLTLRFVVKTKCDVIPSEPVTISVSPAAVDPYGQCMSVVYLIVDEDTTYVEIDTKRMFHLGYKFTADDVTWYKVVDAVDDATEEPVDDQLVYEGYTLPLQSHAMLSGNYYARISLPDQTELIPCYQILQSKTVFYVNRTAETDDEFILVPNYIHHGEIITLLGLHEDDVAQIRIFDATGRKILDTVVENVTHFDYMPSGSAGVYFMRVQTQDRRKTLKFVINN